MRSIVATVLALCLFALSASAFVTPQTPLARTATTPIVSSSTQLHERQWNFNEGQGPFGLKRNAEIWNGRVAQMAFVFVFLQELIQGKGVIQGFQEGDPANIAGVAMFFIVTAGLSAFLGFKGKDDYVDQELKNL